MKIEYTRFKKYLITLTKIVGVFFLLAILSFFLFRNFLLHKAIEKIAAKFRHDYQSNFVIGQASFTGITSVEMQHIILVPDGKDTLVNIGKLESTIRLMQALVLNIRVKELQLKDGYVNFIKNDKGRNFDAFLKHSDSTSLDTNNTKKTN